jgi:DNA-binding transcriptional MerR regulator
LYTVKRLADLAGVTVRTLHHYDHIGLLKPTTIGGNAYRYYGEDAVYRLQQILFYRELGMPLADIKQIVGRRDFDVLAALENHRSALQAQTRRLRRLIRTIDNTTRHLKGTGAMNPKNLFEGFSDEEQEQYAAEAAQRWDPETVKASNDKWKAYSDEQKKRILAEGTALNADLVAAMPKGAASSEAQAAIGRWHAHMQSFWSPTDEQLLGLADLYNGDERFRANYENLAPGLAAFMRTAIQNYVNSRK